MENIPSESDMRNIVKELTQGRELAKQLQSHFNSASSSNETRDFLIYKILSSYDRALSMIKVDDMVDESPRSHNNSPRSDDSDHEVKDGASKKRKLVRWTQKIQVLPGRGIDGQLEDGCSWRKYGQKDILGAKFPRGYYRCTHRYGQGCLATRQIQRSDEDPTMFDITYRGRHTCNPLGNSNNPIHIPDSQNEAPPENLPQLPNQPQQNQHEPHFDIPTNLRVATQNLDNNSSPSFDPFQIPSPSSINLGNYFDNYPSSFISPVTSGTNYFASSPSLISDTFNEFSRIVDITTSATSSPLIDPNFTFNSPELGSNFSFGEYFPL